MLRIVVGPKGEILEEQRFPKAAKLTRVAPSGRSGGRRGRSITFDRRTLEVIGVEGGANLSLEARQLTRPFLRWVAGREEAFRRLW